MKTWQLNDAQDRFIELLQSCVQEPQIVCDQENPIAVIVDIALFKELMELMSSSNEVKDRKRQHRPTISELLDELSEIQTHEPVDIEIPTRQDRPNPIF